MKLEILWLIVSCVYCKHFRGGTWKVEVPLGEEQVKIGWTNTWARFKSYYKGLSQSESRILILNPRRRM